MGDLIKIVGVQYAVNSNHVKGEDMTAQEQQKTIEFLTSGIHRDFNNNGKIRSMVRSEGGNRECHKSYGSKKGRQDALYGE